MTPMSIQHPTPRHFVRWGPVLVVALGLSALVWSCESEQVGYDVTLPLIGPIDFNETSCEVSGDICSTNDDCFDEDGIPVGPCTKTLTPFEPIEVAVALSPSAPSYTFPFDVDTDRWVSPLSVLEAGGESPISLTSANFSVTGGPVTLNVRHD